MACYANTLTNNKTLWLRTNITTNDELKNYITASEEGLNVSLKIYREIHDNEENIFVSLTPSEEPTRVNALLNSSDTIKQVRKAIIDYIEELVS